MVYGLLRNALTNEMVGLVDKASTDKVIGFLAERSAAIQLLVLGEEN